MKQHKLLTGLFLLWTSFTLFAYGCKDDKESELIGTWQVSSAVFNPPVDSHGVIITDAYSRLFPEPCNQDNFFIFESRGVFKDDEGATKCQPTDPQYIQGIWNQSGSTVTITTIKTTVPKDTAITIFNNSVISDSTFTGTVVYTFGTGVAAIDFVLIRQ